MSNFLKLASQIENRLGHYATRLFRVEAHLRQGETRAARQRLDGFLEELEDFEQDVEFPFEMTIVGTQVGFLSGKGSILRGRLPAALLGGVMGWLFGHSTASSYRDAIQELKLRVRAIELQMPQEETEAAGESAETGPPSDSEQADEVAAG
ncbi:MAG: hypothetical protein ABEN55_20080 [Bradymonadaceae bacterium]